MYFPVMMDKIIGSVSKSSKLPYLGSILLKLRLHVPLLGKIGIPRNQEIRVRVKKFPKQILLIWKMEIAMLTMVRELHGLKVSSQ